MRITLAEDNCGLASAITRALAQEGHSVDVFHDGMDTDEHVAAARPDLVILDINLPRLDGVSILRAMRRRGQTIPVLILTARSEGPDRVAGLDAGADDYMVKPFMMDEFLARVRALARRRGTIVPAIEHAGVIVYDRSGGMIRVSGTEIDLSPRERALFDLLFDHNGRVVTNERLIEALYGYGPAGGKNAVELAVSRLRRKLGDDVHIRTIRGLGYMLDPGSGA